MKAKTIIFSAVCSLISLASFAASPAATQSWVKKYVADEISKIEPKDSIDSPLEYTYREDSGEKMTIRFTFSCDTNEAFIVTRSGESFMPVGTRFARVNDYLYKNAPSVYCDKLVGKMEVVGEHYSGELKRVIVGTQTNFYYSATNDIKEIVYHANVNGVQYRSYKISDGSYLFNLETNPTEGKYFEVRMGLISDLDREILINTDTSNRFGFLDLLFGNAYAASPGTKVYTRTKYYYGVQESEGSETFYDIQQSFWIRNWYTDSGDTLTLNVDTISFIDANGNTISYDINKPFCSIESGIGLNYLKYAISYENKPDDGWHNLYNNFTNAIGSSVSRSVFTRIMRAANGSVVNEAFDAKYGKIKEKFDNIISTIEKESAKGPPDDKSDYYFNQWIEHTESISDVFYGSLWDLDVTKKDCTHENSIVGICGDYHCKTCNRHFSGSESGIDLPSEHSYGRQQSDGENVCYYCVNKVPKENSDEKVFCRDTDPDPLHHFGWHDSGDLTIHTNCVCDCEYFHNEHLDNVDGSKVVDYEDLEKITEGAYSGCLRIWKCDRCDTSNYNGVYDPSYIGLTATVVSHMDGDDIYDVGQGLSANKWNNEIWGPNLEYTNCAYIGVCEHPDPEGHQVLGNCGHITFNRQKHEKHGEYSRATKIDDNDEYHKAEVPCKNGLEVWKDPAEMTEEEVERNKRWCNYTFNDVLKPHNFDKENSLVVKVSDKGLGEYRPTDSGHYSVVACGTIVRNEEGTLEVSNDPYKGECGYTKATFHNHSNSGFYSYGNPTESVHDVSNICSRCEYEYFFTTESHVESEEKNRTFKYLNNFEHEVSNLCFKCSETGYRFFVKNDYHSPTNDLDLNVYLYVNESKHNVSNLCEFCKKHYGPFEEDHETDDAEENHKYLPIVVADGYDMANHEVSNRCIRCKIKIPTDEGFIEKDVWWKGEDAPHIAKTKEDGGELIIYKALEGWKHDASNVCDKCSLQYIKEQNKSVACTNVWDIVEDASIPDTNRCEFCSNREIVNHNIGYLESDDDRFDYHWCLNGDKHLKSAHTFETKTQGGYEWEECTVCGFIKTRREIMVNECGCGIKMIYHPYVPGEGQKDEFFVLGGCEYAYSWYLEHYMEIHAALASGSPLPEFKCGCEKCQADHHEECLCQHPQN